MESKITLEQLLDEIRQLINDKNYNCYINTRECEEAIANMENYIDLDSDLDENMTEYIEQNVTRENEICFILFQLLFTVYRRKRYGDLEGYVNKFIHFFKQYPISEFIELLMIYNVKKSDQQLNEVLLRAKRLTESKGMNYDFTTHQGVINFYVEAVCSYYEINLDERNTESGTRFINDAVRKIDYIIDSSKKGYSKFYLNKGRLEILLGNYNLGEEYIVKAIHNIDFSVNRAFTVSEYEQFLNKLEMIKLYDKNDSKLKELDNLKSDNIKSLSLMTALLSFILGAISIFSEVRDIKVLALLMIMYFGLIVLLLGVLLLGVKLLYKDKKTTFGKYNIWLIIIGGGIVLISIVLILLI